MTTLGNAQSSRTPSGLKVAPMSYAKLEQISEGVRPLLPKVNVGGHDWWIDARRVLEETLPKANYNYYVSSVDRLKESAAFAIPEEHLVVVREDVYDRLSEDDVFSRSTVIHELCHVILKHAATLHRGAAVGKHEFYEDSEWQAKSLTAAIMMPIEACKACASARELARLCGTSEEAARYRIEKLVERGILDPARFNGDLFADPN